jgi:type IV pilus assembly protein PilM
MNMRTMLLKRSGALSPIGLDIGTSRIKAAQLRRAGSAWAMHAFASIPRAVEGAPLDAGEASRVGDVLFRRGFTGREVVVSVPDAKLLTVNLELPPRNEQIPLDQIARSEFARSVKTESDPFEFAYWDLPAPARAARSTHVMGVGCRHVDAEPLIDALELAGFELVAMDVEAMALARACAPLMAPAQEITALLDIGQAALRLFVLHQGVATYRRTLGGHGMRDLRKAVSEHIAVEADEEVIDYVLDHVALSGQADLASPSAPSAAAIEQARRVICNHFDAVLAEITTSLSYTAHQYPDAPFRRLLLTGGGAALEGLTPYLAGKLSVDVRAVRCGDLASGSARTAIDEADRAAEFSGLLAVGLAQFDRTRRKKGMSP